MANPVILIVDDNLTNLKLVQYLLSAKGYDVCTACDAPSALASIQEHLPRLILMDIQLPGMDGLTLTRKLKSDPQTKDIPIIALTAFAMKGDEERALEAGCDGYLSKPLDTRALPIVVAKHLAR